MKAFNYFDLGLMPEEPVLGSRDTKVKERRERKRFLITALMYIFVWLGILAQRVLALYQANLALSWQNFGAGFLLVALIVATAIFPSVFPKIFAKMPTRAQKAQGGWFFVQLCVAFQNGFFWQALLSLIVPK